MIDNCSILPNRLKLILTIRFSIGLDGVDHLGLTYAERREGTTLYGILRIPLQGKGLTPLEGTFAQGSGISVTL